MIELSEAQIEALDTATLSKVVKVVSRRLKANDATQQIMVDRAKNAAIYLEAALAILALDEKIVAKEVELIAAGYEGGVT